MIMGNAMYKKNEENSRTNKFKRNKNLEVFLEQLNNNLWIAEEKLIEEKDPDFPMIFIMGPLRSGSTLIMQWLASLGCFSYPTNLMSRFYKTPIIGSKIQLLLTDDMYRFRDELIELNSRIDFYSENGKTNGLLAPNEFWYFWRRFLNFGEIDYLPTSELISNDTVKMLVHELAGIADVFKKPFALKGQILNYNIDYLDHIFKKAIFIHVKRDPLTNVESALQARERQLGDIKEWYSFKIPEYNQLKSMTPYEQVAGQVYYINKAVTSGLALVAEHKKITVNYEDFCMDPKILYAELQAKLKIQGYDITPKYNSAEFFSPSRERVIDKKIIDAYNKISEGCF
jgi:hypothetical protein